MKNMTLMLLISIAPAFALADKAVDAGRYAEFRFARIDCTAYSTKGLIKKIEIRNTTVGYVDSSVDLFVNDVEVTTTSKTGHCTNVLECAVDENAPIEFDYNGTNYSLLMNVINPPPPTNPKYPYVGSPGVVQARPLLTIKSPGSSSSTHFSGLCLKSI